MYLNIGLTSGTSKTENLGLNFVQVERQTEQN